MLYYEQKGEGPIIVLLPGLLASTRYWTKIVNELCSSHRVITIDQLGFGKSPKPNNSNYTIKENIDEYKKLFESIGVENIECLVGYSSSSILAASFAANSSVCIKKIVLITPPIHFTKEKAIEALRRSFRTYKYFMFGPLKPFFIGFVTIFKPIIRLSSPLFLTHVEVDSARDAFSFSWRSLYFSLQNIIVMQNIVPDLNRVEEKGIKVDILFAKNDTIVDSNVLMDLKKKYHNIGLKKIDSDHQIPLNSPAKVIQTIIS